MPPPPWPSTAYGRRGHIQGFNNQRIYTFYQPGVDLLRLLDQEQNLAHLWVAYPERIPYWEHSFPVREIWHWWLRDRPFQLVHAGAVGTEQGGVLLAGKSGSGKSTTSLLCLRSGLLYAGDDYVLVQTRPTPHVYGLYNIGKLEHKDMERLPQLRRLVHNPVYIQAEKAMIYVHERCPEKMALGFPLKAILVPRVTGSTETRLREATPLDALAALAPTTLKHLPRANWEAIQKMRELAGQVPTYVLELGTDLDAIPAVIADFLRAL
jgi:hypothetical protein